MAILCPYWVHMCAAVYLCMMHCSYLWWLWFTHCCLKTIYFTACATQNMLVRSIDVSRLCMHFLEIPSDCISLVRTYVRTSCWQLINLNRNQSVQNLHVLAILYNSWGYGPTQTTVLATFNLHVGHAHFFLHNMTLCGFRTKPSKGFKFQCQGLFYDVPFQSYKITNSCSAPTWKS